jgi:phage-related protein
MLGLEYLINPNHMTEAKIKAALIRFTDGIKNSDAAAISTALNEVEALLAAHQTELHPQLVHFLQGRSYAKALAWLGGGDALAAKPSSPPGGCGGGHQ